MTYWDPLDTLHLHTRYVDFIAPHLPRANNFRVKQPDFSAPPLLADVRDKLPDPFWENHPVAVECYWKTWDLAFRNLRKATPENGFVAPFIDTAFNNCLFMWDSVFILFFCRYGSRAFSFQHTLDNFYCKQRSDGFISREIQQWDGQDRFHPHDPVSTGPNILAWSEWEYFKNIGDKERLNLVLGPLLSYHQWLRKWRTWPDGTYWSCGFASGMDNQPRLPLGYHRSVDHGHLSWIDATAQAALSAKILVEIAEVLERSGETVNENEEYHRLRALMNESMWDAAAGIYTDRDSSGKVQSICSVAGFWPMLAGSVPDEKVSQLCALLEDPNVFNRPHRVPSLGANHQGYDPINGDYWCGAVWPPTNYMILRGLTLCRKDDLAHDIAMSHHNAIVKVFQHTGTVWENYKAESVAEGKPSRPNFVGWGGLGPVAVFLEYVLGFQPDVPAGKLVWDIRQLDSHGVKKYPFGSNGLIDLKCAGRTSNSEEPQIEVHSTCSFVLELRWKGGQKILQIPASF